MNKKKITRIEAEDLVEKIGVLKSEIQHKPREMHIILRLSNNQNIFMTYNLIDHIKNYFIVE